MPVATSDLYSVLCRLVEEWQACQSQLEANAIESVEAFLTATERDEDGHRCSPALDRLNAVEAEIHARARWLAEARDFGCELLARDLADWSDCEIIRRLSSWKDIDREPLVAALEELPGHRHAFVLEQLRKRFPEQLAAIEAKRHVGGPIEPQTAIAEQAGTPGESVKKLRPLVGSQLVSFLEYLIERGLPYESERKSVRQIADCLKSLGYHVKRTAFQEAIRQSNVLTDWRDKRLDEKLVERQRNWEHRSLEALGVTYFAASDLPEPVAMTDDEYEKLTERAIREAIVNRATDCEVSDLRKLVSDATTREERSRVAQLLEGYLSEGGREVAAASY